MNWQLVPYRRALQVTLPIPHGEIAEAVLSFEALGLSPGGNLSIEVCDARGKIWSHSCAEPYASFRRNSSKAWAISAVRCFSAGLFAEWFARKLLSASPPRFCHELPVDKLPTGGTVCVAIRRQLASPVLIQNIRLQTGALSPTELVETPDGIAGFLNAVSFRPGDTLALRLHSQSAQLRLRVLAYGNALASLGEQTIQGVRSLRPRAAFRHSPDYPVVCRLPLPADMETGLYGVQLVADTGEAQTIPFVVRSSQPVAKLLVVASTNTWCAYNEWGGASAYHWRGEQSLGRQRSEVLTKARPNPAADPECGEPHLARSLGRLLEWLAREVLVYDMVTDDDLHADPSLLGRYRCVMFDGHPEYWSANMRDGLETFLAAAGRVIYLGGNGFYWRAEPDGDVLTVVKPSGAFADGTPGGIWSDIGRPESAVLGVAYTTAGAETFAPFEVLEPDHWIFEGCNVRRGTRLGEIGEFGAASGHETDKMDRFTPRGAQRIAKGLNPKGAGADMIYLEHASGGQVFCAGSITFIGALALDERLSRVLRNVLTRFLSDGG